MFNSPNFDVSNPNTLLDLERAKRFYQWSKKAAQELLDSPEKWQQLDDSLRNSYFHKERTFLQKYEPSGIMNYFMAYLRWGNKVGAWMNNEPFSEEDRHIAQEVSRAIQAFPRTQETYRVYRSKRLSRTIVENVDPTGLHFAEHKGGGFSQLITALNTGWNCRLILDSGHHHRGSLSISVDVIHDSYHGNPNVLVSTPEFHKHPNNVSMRRFPLLGWLPFGEGDLDFYIEDKSQVAQTIADVTHHINQMFDDLNYYLPEPPAVT